MAREAHYPTLGDTDEPDLSNETRMINAEVPSNNERELYYPGAPSFSGLGIIEHRYDGFPARGIVRYDVVDWEIVEHNIDADEFEKYHEELTEWVEETLLSGGSRLRNTHVGRVDTHTYAVEHEIEGDRIVVELKTDNKRRLE